MNECVYEWASEWVSKWIAQARYKELTVSLALGSGRKRSVALFGTGAETEAATTAAAKGGRGVQAGGRLGFRMR